MGAALAVLAVAGCGSVTDRGDAAAAVTVRMVDAVTAKDGAAACALLAPDTAAELEQSAGKPCAEAVLVADLPGPGSASLGIAALAGPARVSGRGAGPAGLRRKCAGWDRS